MDQPAFIVMVAEGQHIIHALQICNEMESSAKARGTGIAKRSPDYIAQKMLEGKAVIALHADGTWAGFCYIETWGHGKYVANSGLIVSPELRKSGLARQIKKKIFELSRTKYPDAKIFGLTTALAVMRINSGLGYTPVTYSELTDDEEFWKGCRSCVNFEILQTKNRTNCLCTAMLYDPAKERDFMALPVVEKKPAPKQNSVNDRWLRHRLKPGQQPGLSAAEISTVQV
ncbi:GNAT family N-acetyltransferase [Pontibacter anaerobius]|uniref:GNAT family N-acetyltransferase n=1 Tax=Pontibacter anaerobius TaxID=2993940 RepID=A0ABT3RJY3_9BACT|nr:GNAT family N-acetyltransferase [Pontibacter anaerobius]MCX2741870.1 GNAT family N-acetyltransferase [Pontibacter anaerobius]